MGCGSSKATVVDEQVNSTTAPTEQPPLAVNHQLKNSDGPHIEPSPAKHQTEVYSNTASGPTGGANTHSHVVAAQQRASATSLDKKTLPPIPSDKPQKGAESQQEPDVKRPIPKAIAFEVPADELHVHTKGPPRRLPKGELPGLTTEMLLKKQEAAEQRRKEHDAQKVHPKRKTDVARHSAKAKQFNKAQKVYADLESKQKQTEKKRQQVIQTKLEKLKKKKEHAAKVRQAAKKGDSTKSQHDDDRISWDGDHDSEEGEHVSLPASDDED
eukprot:Colp12_sorted_trinity150504_noHs@10639